MVHAAVAIVLLSPQIPLLFMGEEWATARPFMFFCDFEPDLADAVREGRQREFAQFAEFAEAAAQGRIPDATAQGSFDMCRLGLVGARARPAPDLARPISPDVTGAAGRDRTASRRHGPGGAFDRLGPAALRAEWTLGDGALLLLFANFGDAAVPLGDPRVRRNACCTVPVASRRGTRSRPSCAAFYLIPPGERERDEPARRPAPRRRSARHRDAIMSMRSAQARGDEETLSRLIGLSACLPTRNRPPRRSPTRLDRAPFGLAPVHILDPDDPDPVLPLPRPGWGAPRGGVEWHIRLENGDERAGSGDGDTLRLPGGLPLGYHRLAVTAGSTQAEIDLIVAPRSCHLPEGLLPGARSWGLTAQLYGLRSERDWGIGDFTDLEMLCRRSGVLGAAAIGVNPMHALFAAEPRHFSPYSPSSRVWLNYLYIDVTAVPGFAEDEAVQALAPAAAIAAARDADLIDYAAVAAVKRPVLEALFERFRGGDMESGTALAEEFRRFRDMGGQKLDDFAVFEALHEHFLGAGSEFSWHSWPAAVRDPRSAETAAFARERASRVRFFQFLQWIADRQLGRAAAPGREAGLTIGLYRDFAVGASPHGAEAWADNELVVSGASIGAPPDPLSRSGQNWGLAPLNPLVLRRRGFAPLITALRANMRHAGILRIDHVMGLRRLYWVPSGSPATSGAYVEYPFEACCGCSPSKAGDTAAP